MRSMRAASVAFLLAASSVAGADDWRQIVAADLSHGTMVRILLDVDSVKARHGVLSAWVKVLYSAPQHLTGGKSFRSQYSLWGFNCTDEQGTTLAYTQYEGADGTGDVLRTEQTPATQLQWTDVMPETAMQLALQLACSVETAKK
jgi:hypothetical protein